MHNITLVFLNINVFNINMPVFYHILSGMSPINILVSCLWQSTCALSLAILNCVVVAVD